MNWLRFFDKGEVLALLLTVMVLGWHHQDRALNLNSTYWGDSEDALKNYYTLIYHIQHDATFSRFEGMNYPFGEQVVFTDNQPLLSNTIKLIKPLWDLSPYTVGIVNGSMLFSILLSAFLLARIWLRLGVPEIVAGIAAAGVALLSPQMMRMQGHYALAHCWVIPGFLLLLMRSAEQQGIKRSLQMGVYVLAISGLHLYYFAIMALFSAFYFAVELLGKEARKKILNKALHFSIQIVLPFLLFKLWIALTDPVSDRPSSPNGFLHHVATFKSIFLPIGLEYANALTHLFDLSEVKWEGQAYVGGMAVFGLLFGVLIQIRRAVKRGWRYFFRPFDAQVLNHLWWAALLLLLFSFGYPFKRMTEAFGGHLHLEGLVAYLGPLKQFRSLGRLSWAFYYVLNIMLVVGLVRLVNGTSFSIWIKRSLLALPLLLLMSEAFYFQGKTLQKSFAVPLLEQAETGFPDNHWVNTLTPSDYQAIIPLPYFHEGSENFSPLGPKPKLESVFSASLLTGMPTTAVQMSRTSYSQSFDNIELLLTPLRPPHYLTKLPSQKPFLLWVDRKTPLSENDKDLLSRAAAVYEDEDLLLMSIACNAWEYRLEDAKAKAKMRYSETALFQHGVFLTSDSNRSFLYLDFEDQKQGFKYRGKAGFKGDMSKFQAVYKGTLPGQDTIDYVFSSWVYLGYDGLPGLRLVFEQLDSNGKYLKYATYHCGELITARDGDWGMITFPFKAKAFNSTFNFVFHKRKEKVLKDFYLDEVLIRPKDLDVFKPLDDGLYFNGLFYDNPGSR